MAWPGVAGHGGARHGWQGNAPGITTMPGAFLVVYAECTGPGRGAPTAMLFCVSPTWMAPKNAKAI